MLERSTLVEFIFLIPMKTQKFIGIPSLLLVTVISFLLPSCVFFHDTVAFNALGKMPAVKTPVPKVEIDTKITVGTLLGGSVKSHKPYDIRLYYMDDTFTFATFEITALTVTYADGSNDPGAALLKLPMRFQSTVYESYNSMAGGAVVVNKSRILDAHLSDTIQRDEPFTLSIKGQFIKDNGTIIPFKITEKYDMTRDKRTESWADFVSGC